MSVSSKRVPAPLDAIADEAIERFVGIMLAAGYDRKSLRERLAAVSSAARPQVNTKRPALQRELIDAPHLLTLWYTERKYLDPKGEPRPLRKGGRGASLASLVRQVRCQYGIEEVLPYLLQTGTVARRGAHFVPLRRRVSLRGAGRATHARDLRVVLGLMRTVQHNDQADAPRWFEYWAENAAVPASAVPMLDKRIWSTGLQFLSDEDDRMERAAAERKNGEPVVKRYVGVYLLEEPCSTDTPVRKEHPSR